MKQAPTTTLRALTAGVIVIALVAVTVWAAQLLRPRPSVMVLGDSMVAMAKTQLEDAGSAAGYQTSVDGIPGITLAARLPSVSDLGHHRSGPVVIELGTNDVLQGVPGDELVARADQAAAALAANPCVVFVTVGTLYGAGGLAAVFNQHLEELAAAHPNFHVFDWSTEFAQHPDWTTDTVHLRPEYQSRYAHGIIDTVHDTC